MTEQLTLKDMQILISNAKVLELLNEDDQIIFVLDKTPFYPQGGGQASDTGTINTSNSKFLVKKVIKIEGKIFHYGEFEYGQINVSDEVDCTVNKERRTLNSRLHSAGHMIDIVLRILKTNLKPLKGYHFPDGPYVEYEGTVNEDEIEKLKLELEELVNKLIEENLKTSLRFSNESPNNRIISFGNFETPCGGTHVVSSAEISKINIRKIKSKQGHTKISYTLNG